MEPAIRLRQLKKTYAGSHGQPPKDALKGIDLDISIGSMFALLTFNFISHVVDQSSKR